MSAELTPREAAVELLLWHFGDEYGGWLIWNRTCYPLDDETMWGQAKGLVRDGVPDEDGNLPATEGAPA